MTVYAVKFFSAVELFALLADLAVICVGASTNTQALA